MNKFRYDINGLRAYAVLFVVLFHFGIFGFSGGFIGVDVFFVISGFLMTKIIMDGLKQNNFSILYQPCSSNHSCSCSIMRIFISSRLV